MYVNNLIHRKITNTDIDDWYHVSPSRLNTADAILKTIDEYQNPSTVVEPFPEICKVVAVTLEKKVAMVVIAMYFFVAFLSRSSCTYGRAGLFRSALHR